MKVRTRVNSPYAFLSKYSSLSVRVNCIGSSSVRAHSRQQIETPYSGVIKSLVPGTFSVPTCRSVEQAPEFYKAGQRYPLDKSQETDCAIRYVEIYQADTAIYLLNNWNPQQKKKKKKNSIAHTYNVFPCSQNLLLILTIVYETWRFWNNSVQGLLCEFRPDSFQHGSQFLIVFLKIICKRRKNFKYCPWSEFRRCCPFWTGFSWCCTELLQYFVSCHLVIRPFA